MTALAEGAHELLLARLLSLARRATARYDLPQSVALTLINLSENATYLVEDAASGRRWALRVHREGYHARQAIESELAWVIALRAGGIATTPIPLPGHDGQLIQVVDTAGLLAPRHVVLFAWEEGSEPQATDVPGFEAMGEIAARMHGHVRVWQRPDWFTRHTWDFSTSLGDSPHWGRWRDGLGMTPQIERTLERTVDLIGKRLARFGQGVDRFGLVHGDMRLANLLVEDRHFKVIDFDDSGFSWFLYDCATTVSFFEDDPTVPDLIAAWVRGYRRVAPISAEDEAEIPTFVMLRRLLLVAWIGSHAETQLAQSMGREYTRNSVGLCDDYLQRFAR